MTEDAGRVLPPGPALTLRRRSLLLALAAALVVSGTGVVVTVTIASGSLGAWVSTVQAGALAAMTVYLVLTVGPTWAAAAAAQSAVRTSGCRRSRLRRAVLRDQPLALGRLGAIQADVWAEATWTHTTLALPAAGGLALVATIYLPLTLPNAGAGSGLLAVMIVVGAVGPVVAMLWDRRRVSSYLRSRGAELRRSRPDFGEADRAGS